MKQQFTLKPMSKMVKILIGAGAGLLVALILLLSSLTVIEQSEVGVYTNLGKYKSQFEAGLNFKAPFTSKIYKYNTRMQVYEDVYEAYTWDTQLVTFEINVQYQLDKKNVYQVFINFGTMEQLEQKLTPMFFSESKNVFKEYSASKTEITKNLDGEDVEDDFNEVIQKRDDIEAKIRQQLIDKSKQFYVEVVNVTLKDIAFSSEYEKAVEEKQVAYQNYLAEKNRALASIEKAKGEAKALIESTQGEAKSKEIAATAEAEVMRIMKASWLEIKGLTEGDVSEVVLQQMFIKAWNGVLPETWLSSDALSSIFAPKAPEAGGGV
jgi:regulator of protease activity HflC (stomatin/prohibitin superfamily)